MMPEKMMRDIPLPTPRSVICSPSHIRKTVPVVSVIITIRRKPQPGSITAPSPKLPASSAVAISRPWKIARATVP
jgi:hypothetical protein